MRVISGKKRGYRLTPPNGEHTRPTTDRVKESLFNIIQMRFPCSFVLDLFAGSGALGIEALSRGAECAVFAEKDRRTLDILKKNINGSDLSASATVFDIDSFDLLTRLSNGHISVLKNGRSLPFRRSDKFDIIFLDPPYNKGLIVKSLNKIHDCDLLSESGIIITETEVSGEATYSPHFNIIKTAKYGKTVIMVMQKVRE